MRIDHAIDEYLASRRNALATKTYRWYTDFLNKFLAWCNERKLTDLSQINASHVASFVSDKPEESSNTKHHRGQIVKTFLKWCSDDDEMGVRRKVVDRIEMPPAKQPDIEILAEEDIKKLFRACDGMRTPHRNRAILHMLLDTGVRASEICYNSQRPSDDTGLLMENLYLGRDSESYIRVMGKGRKPRTIGLGQATTLAMRKYINRERGQNRNSPFVFLSVHGDDEPLSVRMLQQLLDELGERARVPNVHPHRFRHTFAVNQLMEGTSDLVLMRLMGHTTLDSTKIYTRAMTQVQARLAAVSVVDKMNNKRRR